jgi:hypothetical protein
MFESDLLEAAFREAVSTQYSQELDEILSDLNLANVEYSARHNHRM